MGDAALEMIHTLFNEIINHDGDWMFDGQEVVRSNICERDSQIVVLLSDNRVIKIKVLESSKP